MWRTIRISTYAPIKESDEQGRKFFYFLSTTEGGAYNLLEVYADRKGNLTSKTFYKTKKTVPQRVLSLKKSEHLTSVTDGASLLSGAKIQLLFENKVNIDKKSAKFRDGGLGLEEAITKMKVDAANANAESLEAKRDAMRAIGGNTSYRENGSMNPKDAAFFGYLYSLYNVIDVINISGRKLYARNVTGYDVRMILIDGRKSGEFKRVFPLVKSNARAEQVTTFDELYNRVQNDISQIQQNGHGSDVSDAASDRVDRTVNQANLVPTHSGITGRGIHPVLYSSTVRTASPIRAVRSSETQDGGRTGVAQLINDLTERLVGTEEMQQAMWMLQRVDPAQAAQYGIQVEKLQEEPRLYNLIEDITVAESDYQ